MLIQELPNQFKIKFDYNPKLIADIKKNCRTAKWDRMEKVWTVDISERQYIERLQGRVGKKAVESTAVGIVPPMPDLDIEIPLKRTLFNFQAQGVAQGLKFKRFVNGDDPGLGKTTQAIATLIAAAMRGEDVFPALVICPSTLKINWHKEWEIVAGMGKKTIILQDSIRKSWPAYISVAGCQIFICNYDSLQKYFVEKIEQPIDPETGKKAALRLNHITFKSTINLFKSVIIDELHQCKEMKTMRAKLVKGLCQGKDWVIGLTGTPVVNKTQDLLSQLSIIGQLTNLGGYTTFKNRYCNSDEYLEELNYRLLTTCFFQRKKTEVLKDLPGKMRQVMTTDITNRREYDKAENDLEYYLKELAGKTEEQVDAAMRAYIIVQINVLRNLSALGKVEAAIELIDEIIESGQKVAIFVDKIEIGNKLKNKYHNALTIRGDVTTEERNGAVEQFQSDPKRNIIILSMKAAGVGLTLTAAYNCIFIEQPWHYALLDQCESRFDRIGQKNVVFSKILLGEKTIDEKIWQIIEKKGKLAQSVTGNSDNIEKELINFLLKKG
jgi:SWI/SNF-related matrix-associated actin-dependent regulator 1 of chromatin subfamily A